MSKYENLFVVGDWVYCPLFLAGKLRKLKKSDQQYTPIFFEDLEGYNRGFTFEGFMREDNRVPYLLHATPENYAALKVLYPDVVFQEPPKRGSELTKELLKLGKPVWCWVSNTSEGDALEEAVLAQITAHDAKFFRYRSSSWVYAVPVPRSFLLLEQYSFPDDYDPSLVIEVSDEDSQ